MATHFENVTPSNISYHVIQVDDMCEVCLTSHVVSTCKLNEKIQLRLEFHYDSIDFTLNSKAKVQVSLHHEEPKTNCALFLGWNSLILCDGRGSFTFHTIKDRNLFSTTKYIVIALMADNEPKVQNATAIKVQNVTSIRCSSEKLSQAQEHPGQFDKVMVICEGKPFVTNQGILSVWSPVFETMFKRKENLEAQIAEVVIDDFEAPVVKLFLGYLQGLEVSAKELESHIVDLYRIAHKYDVKELVKEAENVIALTVNETNFGDLLAMSQLYESKTVKDAMMKYAENNVGQVLGSDLWKDFVVKRLK